jgi:hypothetical protein
LETTEEFFQMLESEASKRNWQNFKFDD